MIPRFCAGAVRRVDPGPIPRGQSGPASGLYPVDGVGELPAGSDRQRAYLVKAERSLDCARLLLRAGSPDFAASRAYFAMYYAANALLLDRGLAVRKHGPMILALGREFAATGVIPAEFHRWLIDANDSRLEADYGEEFGVAAEDAAGHIGQAARFLAAARALLDARPLGAS